MISTDLETWLLYCVLIRKDQNSIEKLKQKVTYSSEKKKPHNKRNQKIKHTIKCKWNEY